MLLLVMAEIKEIRPPVPPIETVIVYMDYDERVLSLRQSKEIIEKYIKNDIYVAIHRNGTGLTIPSAVGFLAWNGQLLAAVQFVRALSSRVYVMGMDEE